jgi:hypothetical protein
VQRAAPPRKREIYEAGEWQLGELGDGRVQLRFLAAGTHVQIEFPAMRVHAAETMARQLAAFCARMGAPEGQRGGVVDGSIENEGGRSGG